MTHKFAIVVDKNFYNNIQNNVDFYVRIIVLDVIRVLVNESEVANKYSSDLFYKCAKSISNEIEIFEDHTSIIFYLQLSSEYLDDFFEEPLDNPE